MSDGPGLDYKAIFSRVVLEMMTEIFEAHGIYELEEEVFDEIVTECTKEVFWPALQEFRRESRRPSLLQGFRPRW